MDKLEIIMLSVKEVRENKYSYDITYRWNLKKYTNEYIRKAEIDSQA